ncbi:class I SAM-dependent methyltransferase [Ehrlichia muris]|uniref:class I SAM-dependent methyltransferase n=1 Tax=Ehrlichia muris TaxID=35795 RepID=UPI0037C03C2C
MPIFDRSLVKLYRDKLFYTKDSNFIFSEISDILLDKVSLFSVTTGLALNIGVRTNSFIEDLLRKKLISSKEQVIQCDLSYCMLYNVQSGYRVVADEEALPFCNNTFDIVISNASLHNVNNLFRVLLSIYNIIKTRGVFLAALFGSKTLYELKHSIIRAEMGLGVAPRVLPFIHVQDIVSLLKKTGYSDIVVDVNTIMVEYNDIYTLFRDLKNMGEGNVLYARNKYPLTRTIITKIFENYKRYFSIDKINIPATFEIITLKASKV